ncbi:MAG: glycosyltransferase family 9 protein [Gammaproteobacteria bacterium]|nr:glycosyltransferase family 9 protein [Gammaproteobacteria bacterium]MDH5241631.1 glycosyltransferase family 9 protein [Gammaproteobacteria bacterium]MDH5261552.1 glycosyltransferase family 9 protein [Gammaproteobacteria bacterium]MDH5582282.1 glycosyltransferase family 9 protein [Gammaproteobacteria bacterium]
MSNLILNSPPERICVIRLSAIGDTCHALAVVRRIQDSQPAAKITWIIGKTEASLMAGIPDIEFIIFDKSKGRSAYQDVRAQLAGRSFDIALCMHASMRANFLCLSIKAPIRLGFDRKRAKDFQWLFTNRRIDPAPGQHALEAMMSFAVAIGAKPQPIRWDIPLDEDVQEFAADFRSPNKPLVVISPCSSNRSRNFRNWSVERYRAAIQHLRNKGARVVLTGGRSELELEYGTALAADGAADNLIGKTSLKQLAALIAAADLVICPDSGPAHMATAFATPVLGLYATSNPDRTGPYASRELTVNRYPDAVRQYLGKSVQQLRWGQRVRHPDAMDLITADEVIGKIDGYFDLESRPGKRA